MSRVYAAMRNAMLVVEGPPDDCRVEERLTDHDIECVAAHPDAPNRVFCGTFDSGLRRSTDGGDAWKRVGAGAIDPTSVTSLAVDPADPDVVWAGTEPSRVYRSVDGGDTWTEREGLTDLPSAREWSFPPRPHTHHVRWLAVDPGDSAHLYVGVEAGALVQTHDAGRTWEDRRPDARRDNHTLATHSEAPARVYTAAGDGYAESGDAGATWTHPQRGLDHRYCWSVAVDPGDPDVVLVSSASGAHSAHNADAAESYLYRRRGDDAWERLDDRGVPTGEGVLRAVLAAGDAPGEVYVLNNRGLYRSTDAGDDWERFAARWDGLTEQTARGLAVV